jgi:hypothetical protein
VLALILIVRGGRLLLWTVTAFTVAHSITLSLATLGVVHVPGPPVEVMIALSIMLLACEIIRLRYGQISLTSRWPWIVAFSFGLLHGFGFASALTDIGLPQGDIPLALLSFNEFVRVPTCCTACLQTSFRSWTVAPTSMIFFATISATGSLRSIRCSDCRA